METQDSTLADDTERRPRSKYGRRYVTPEQLVDCRLDPAWEARRAILNYAICRICGALRTRIGNGKLGHLMQMHPELTLRQYHRLYPSAPLRSLKEDARDCGISAERAAERRASLYVTGEEILACRAEPNWEDKHNKRDYVVCRICNFKSRFSIAYGRENHLMLCHDLSWRDYENQFPGAPRSSHDFRERSASKARAERGQLKSLRDKSLPVDWSNHDPEEIFIGLILLQQPYTSNEELAEHLDASGGPKCRFSGDGSWGIITRPGTAANYISKIRRWVGRRGKAVRAA